MTPTAVERPPVTGIGEIVAPTRYPTTARGEPFAADIAEQRQGASIATKAVSPDDENQVPLS